MELNLISQQHAAIRSRGKAVFDGVDHTWQLIDENNNTIMDGVLGEGNLVYTSFDQLPNLEKAIQRAEKHEQESSSPDRVLMLTSDTSADATEVLFEPEAGAAEALPASVEGSNPSSGELVHGAEEDLTAIFTHSCDESSSVVGKALEDLEEWERMARRVAGRDEDEEAEEAVADAE